MSRNGDLIERVAGPPAPYFETRRVRFDRRTYLVVCEAADNGCYIRVEEEGADPRWYLFRDEGSAALQ